MDDVDAVIQKLDRHDFQRCAVLIIAQKQQPFERPVRWFRSKHERQSAVLDDMLDLWPADAVLAS
ncbi:hypothetical protein [Actinoplanes sp. NPDC026619]|uniref:hypothetical protein n=1 Tax=Actinoplanes sp. NPDC026619 TaxID=3155798 RepID=UPI0033ED476B